MIAMVANPIIAKRYLTMPGHLPWPPIISLASTSTAPIWRKVPAASALKASGNGLSAPSAVAAVWPMRDEHADRRGEGEAKHEHRRLRSGCNLSTTWGKRWAIPHFSTMSLVREDSGASMQRRAAVGER